MEKKIFLLIGMLCIVPFLFVSFFIMENLIKAGEGLFALTFLMFLLIYTLGIFCIGESIGRRDKREEKKG